MNQQQQVNQVPQPKIINDLPTFKYERIRWLSYENQIGS